MNGPNADTVSDVLSNPLCLESLTVLNMNDLLALSFLTLYPRLGPHAGQGLKIEKTRLGDRGTYFCRVSIFVGVGGLLYLEGGGEGIMLMSHDAYKNHGKAET